MSDINPDVRTATLAVLGEFLKEIKDVLIVQQEKGIWKNNTTLEQNQVEEIANATQELTLGTKDVENLAKASKSSDDVAILKSSNTKVDSSTYFSGQGNWFLIENRDHA